MIKILAIAVALVLSLGVISGVYAQNATSLQIQIVPEIQRGHQQHLTIFAVDDTGNQVNGSGEIVSSVENAKGKLVGPKTVYTESGEIVSYKVGPNTSPQNITVSSCLADSELCAEQNYYVFPKGQAQVPAEPAPEFPPAIPVPEEPTPEIPVTNDSEDGEIVVPANETEVTLPENGTDVTINDTGEAEPLPPVTEANETVPIEGNVTVPVANETTTPEEPEPLPPVNETVPIEGNVTVPVGNETAEIPPIINETQGNVTIPSPEPPVFNETIPAGNETVPIEGNITIPSATNQTQNTTVEPEPIPPTNGGNGTPNGTIPAEPEGTTPVNASDAFTNLENTTAILDQKLDEVIDNSNETNRGELKANVGETIGAMGEVSGGFVEATTDQLQITQNAAISVSESIDEILIADAEQTDEQGGAEGDAEGEDEQGEDEQ